MVRFYPLKNLMRKQDLEMFDARLMKVDIMRNVVGDGGTLVMRFLEKEDFSVTRYFDEIVSNKTFSAKYTLFTSAGKPLRDITLEGCQVKTLSTEGDASEPGAAEIVVDIDFSKSENQYYDIS